jgi:hypothetical protein
MAVGILNRPCHRHPSGNTKTNSSISTEITVTIEGGGGLYSCPLICPIKYRSCGYLTASGCSCSAEKKVTIKYIFICDLGKVMVAELTGVFFFSLLHAL